MSNKIEFGDFQTPLDLAIKTTDFLRELFNPDCIIEPSCGKGYFLEAAVQSWGEKIPLVGYEINSEYIDDFRTRCPVIYKQSKVEQANFFDLNLKDIFGKYKTPLVLGNPPWVTNSQLGQLGGKNLPVKSNVKGLKGFEARSGKSNFDISEWMIMKLSEELKLRNGILAMLCKTSVARQIFLLNFKRGHRDVSYKIFHIDAKLHFSASVDACLFLIDYKNSGDADRCDVYSDIDLNKFIGSIGINNDTLVANIDWYLATKRKVTTGVPKKWRSGIKHDATKVMELSVRNDSLENGFGEVVKLESEYVYPLLKSSDLANTRLIPRRYVIVPQTKVGEDTSHLEKKAPKLWNYLNQHCEALDNRKSSIYKKQSRFSIFGVGEYSFKPYKIAVSSMYKKIEFCLLKPFKGQPIMVDDTCYLLGFDDCETAEYHLEILRSKDVQKYISSLVFLDAKRPLNSDILKTIGFKDANQMELLAI